MQESIYESARSGSHSTFPERFRIANIPKILKALSLFKPEVSEAIILDLTSNAKEPYSDYLKNAVEWRQASPLTRRTFFAQAIAGIKYKLPKRIPCPTLILASESDRLVSAQCSKKIAGAIEARIVLHPTAGHDLSLDEPKWLAQELKAFFKPE